MYVDSRIIDSDWEFAESRRLADRIVRDVLGDHRGFTRAVRVNDRACEACAETDALSLERPYIQQKLSRDEVDRKIREHGDLSKNQDSILHLLRHDAFLPMAEALGREYPDFVFERSGLILYRSGNYMGWHTNSTNPINRIYFAFSDTGDSGFVHYDLPQGRVHDDRDAPGWNVREFEAGDGVNDPLYWHGVYSYCNRISIGFRVTPKVPEQASETSPSIEGSLLFGNEWAHAMQLSTLAPNKRYRVPFRALRHLLTPERLQELSLGDIASQTPDDSADLNAAAAERPFAGIVVKGMPTTDGKPFRLIEGSGHLSRLQVRGEPRGLFYVLTAAQVMAHLVVEDVSPVS